MFKNYKQFTGFLFEVLNIEQNEIGIKTENYPKAKKGVCFEITNEGSNFFVISAQIFNKEKGIDFALMIEFDLDELSEENNMTNEEYIIEVRFSLIEKRLLFENNFYKAVYEQP